MRTKVIVMKQIEENSKSESAYLKLAKNFGKIANKFCNNVTLEDYLKLSTENYSIKFTHNNGKTLGIVTEPYQKYMVRTVMVNTLKDSNYKRRNNKWNTTNVISFIHEVFELEKIKDILTNKDITNISKDISKRYNVKIERLKTQVALFLINYSKGNDHYGIDNYFTKYDIFNYKYGDIDNLQKAVEANKLTEEEYDILNEIYDL